MKVNVKHFGYNNLLQDFMKSVVKIAMNVRNNSFHEFKVMEKVIITETFNVDFLYKFIKS